MSNPAQPPPTTSAEAPSTRAIGPYQVERELGRGGMGVVYLATDPRLGRQVAIKLLPGREGARPERLARLEREARALATLNHPAVATLFSIEEHSPPEGGRVRGVLVLEYIPGPTLAERLRAGPIPPDEGLRLMAQVAAGLEAAHAAGVVHRDLKPDNVKITAEGQAKILDFGIAKSESDPWSAAESDLPAGAASDLALTRAGTVMGTPGYMSPEQARGSAIDKRTDIWSFGCVLFEVLTGARAFPGATVGEAMKAVLEGEPPLHLLPPGAPGRAGDLLVRCLQKDPARRLRDIGDARLELEQIIEQRAWSPTGTRTALSAGTLTATTTLTARGGLPISGLRLLVLGGALGLIAGMALTLILRGAPGILLRAAPSLRVGLPLASEARPLSTPQATPSGLGTFFIESRDRRLHWQSLTTDEGGVVEAFGAVTAFALSPSGAWLGALVTEGATQRLLVIPLRGDRPAGPPLEIAHDLGAAALTWAGEDAIVVLMLEPAALRLWGLRGSAAAPTPRDLPLPPPARADAPRAAVPMPALAATSTHVLVTLLPASAGGSDDAGSAPASRAPSVWAVPIAPATPDTEGSVTRPAPSGALIEQALAPQVVGADTILFIRGRALMAAPLDPATPALLGEPVALPVGEVDPLRPPSGGPSGVLIVPEAEAGRFMLYTHLRERIEAVRP